MSLEQVRTTYAAGHSYSDITIANNARAHVGDIHNYNLVECNKSHTPARQPDFKGLNSRPLRTVGNHVPREILRAQMRSRLQENDRRKDDITTTLAVCGLGGAGKTQLVLDYITTHRDKYVAIVWLDAFSLATLEKDYVRIHEYLAGDQSESISIETRISEVKTWPRKYQGRWLFIFDSADNIDYPDNPGYIDLQQFLPHAGSIDVVITTRSRTLRNMTGVEGIEVDELEPSEARELFLRRSPLTKSSPQDCAEIDRIANELGYLALTINLAATYIDALPNTRIGDYLVKYDQRINLLSRKPNRVVDRYDKSTLATWETTYGAIVAECRRAADLIAFLGFLSPSDIFYEFFTKSEKADQEETRPYSSRDSSKILMGSNKENHAMASTFRNMLSWRHNKRKTGKLDASFRASDIALKGFSKPEFEHALELLSLFSFLRWQEERQAYTMHRLVRDWAYERLEPGEQAEMCVNVCNHLVRFALGLEENPATSLRLVPHIMSCFTILRRQCESGLLLVSRVLENVIKLAEFLRVNGQYKSEYDLRTFAYTNLQEQSESKSVDVLEALRSLAQSMQRQGHYVKAEATFRQVYQGMQDLLGLEHENTLASKSYLALVLQEQGKYFESEKLLRGAYRSYERELGKHHLDTVSCLRNLALVLRDLGRYKEAEKLLRQALETMQKRLSQTKPNLLTTIGHLGLVLQDQGRYDEAEQHFRRAEEGYIKRLGPSHHDTLTATRNLGAVLQNQGHLEAAEQRFRQVYEGRRDLGTSHLSTLVSVNDLGLVLHAQQKHGEAEKLLREALDGYTTGLGATHPHALTGKMNLGQVLLDQEKYEDAEQMYQEAFESCEETLGESHPDTYRSVWKLAHLAKIRQSIDEASSLYDRAVRGLTDTLGADHPVTMECCDELEELRSLTSESHQTARGRALEV